MPTEKFIPAVYRVRVLDDDFKKLPLIAATYGMTDTEVVEAMIAAACFMEKSGMLAEHGRKDFLGDLLGSFKRLRELRGEVETLALCASKVLQESQATQRLLEREFAAGEGSKE
jgi:hypothetical protein